MSGKEFSSILSLGKKRGQRVDLVVEIRDILRHYTFGERTLVEYVQNAEDAGASVLSFEVDYRSFNRSFSSGPSLLIYNDELFREQDIDNIVNFKNSNKRYSMENIGKFGQGFNVCYHFSDVIEILSQDFLYILDPCCLTGLVDASDPGFLIHWKGISDRKKLEDTKRLLEPFFGLYGFKEDGFPKNRFEGTIIRLSLRQTESRISNKMYKAKRIERDLIKLSSRFPSILLFQMKLRKMSLEIITDKGERKVASCSFNLEEGLMQKRKNFIRSFSQESEQAMERKQLSISRQFVLDYKIKMKIWKEKSKVRTMRTKEFIISHRIDSDGPLFKKNMSTKASDFEFRLVPHLSIAVNLNRLRNKDCDYGGIFVGLPTGMKSGFPFHLHARFELSPNRREVILEDDGYDERTKWNKDLLCTLFPKVYARMLVLSRNDLDVDSFNQLLPSQKFQDSKFGKISLKCLIREIIRNQYQYIRLSDGSFSSINGAQLVQKETFFWMNKILVESKKLFGWIPNDTFKIMELERKRGMNASFFVNVLSKVIRNKKLIISNILDIWKYVGRLMKISRLNEKEKKALQKIEVLDLVPVLGKNRKQLQLVACYGYHFVKPSSSFGKKKFLIRYLERISKVRILDSSIFNKIPKICSRMILKQELRTNEKILQLMSNCSLIKIPSEEERKEIISFFVDLPSRTIEGWRQTIKKLPIYKSFGGLFVSIQRAKHKVWSNNRRYKYVESSSVFLEIDSLSNSSLLRTILEIARKTNANFEILELKEMNDICGSYEVQKFFNSLGIDRISIKKIFEDVLFPRPNFEALFNGLRSSYKEDLMCLLLQLKDEYYVNRYHLSNGFELFYNKHVHNFRRLKCINCGNKIGWKKLLDVIDGEMFRDILGEGECYVTGKMKNYTRILRKIADFRWIPGSVILRSFKKIVEEKKNPKLSIYFLQHLEKEFSNISLKNIYDDLKKIDFIPVREYSLFGELLNSSSLRFGNLSNSVSSKYAELCSQTFNIIDEEVTSLPKINNYFGWSRTDFKKLRSVVYKELLKIAQFYNSSIKNKVRIERILKKLPPLLHKFYSILSEESTTPSYLSQNVNWIWSGRRAIGFVSSETTSIRRIKNLSNSHLNFIPNDFQIYKKMFKLFGVKERFCLNDLLKVYSHMCSEVGVDKITEKKTFQKIVSMTKVVYDFIFDEDGKELDYYLLKKMMVILPSKKNQQQLHYVKEMMYDDVPFIPSSEDEFGGRTYFVHEDIPRFLCVGILNIPSKAETVLSFSEKAITIEGEYGTSKSVKTKQSYFLRDFLQANPEGDGIISEILQNADDAGAKEVIIMYNENKYGNRVLPGYKGRGESVMIFNDAMFSEDDFNGIQNPLKSIKRDDCSKTGKFGKGISVYFHIGDTYEILSSKYFCVMDPFRERFCQYSFLEKSVTGFTDQFVDPYQVFGEIDFEKEYPYTIFRIPVRTTSSEIKKTGFDRSNFVNIARSFQSGGKAESCLLFLKNVEKLRIMILRKNKKIPDTIMEVNKSGGWRYQETIQKLIQSKNSKEYNSLENPILKNPVVDEVTMNFSQRKNQKLEKKKWILTCFVNSDMDALKRPKSLPIGAVACILDEDVGKKNKIEGRVFSTLMLKQKTGIPAHINGDFEISDNRSRLTSRTDATGKEDISKYAWNKMLYEKTVFACFKTLLDHIRSLGHGCVKTLYSLFVDPEEKRIFEEEEEEENEGENSFQQQLYGYDYEELYSSKKKKKRQSTRDEYSNLLFDVISKYLLNNEFFLSSDLKFKKIEEIRNISELPDNKEDIITVRRFLIETKYPNYSVCMSLLPSFYREKIKCFDQKDLLKYLFSRCSGEKESEKMIIDYSEEYIRNSNELLVILKFLTQKKGVLKPKDFDGLFIIPLESNQIKRFSIKQQHEQQTKVVFKKKDELIVKKEEHKELFLDPKFSSLYSDFFKLLGVRELGIYDLNYFRNTLQKDLNKEKIKKIWKFFRKRIGSESKESFFKFFKDWNLIPVINNTQNRICYMKLSEINNILITKTEEIEDEEEEEEKRKEDKPNLDIIAQKSGILITPMFQSPWKIDKTFIHKLEFQVFNFKNFVRLLNFHHNEFNNNTNRKEKQYVRKFLDKSVFDDTILTRNQIKVLLNLQIFENKSMEFVKIVSGEEWRIIPYGLSLNLNGKYLIDHMYGSTILKKLGVREISFEELEDYFITKNNGERFHVLEIKKQVELIDFVNNSFGKFYDVNHCEYKINQTTEWKIIRNNSNNCFEVSECIVSDDFIIRKIYDSHPLLIPFEYLKCKEFVKMLREWYDISVSLVKGSLFLKTANYVLKNSDEDFENCILLIDLIAQNWNFFSLEKNIFEKIIKLKIVPSYYQKKKVLSSFENCYLVEDTLLIDGVGYIIQDDVVLEKLSRDLIKLLKLKTPSIEDTIKRIRILKTNLQKLFSKKKKKEKEEVEGEKEEEEEKVNIEKEGEGMEGKGEEEEEEEEEEVSEEKKKKYRKEVEDSVRKIYDLWLEKYEEADILETEEDLQNLKKLLEDEECIYISSNPTPKFVVPRKCYYEDPYNSSISVNFSKIENKKEYMKYFALFTFLGVVDKLPDFKKEEENKEDNKFLSILKNVFSGGGGGGISFFGDGSFASRFVNDSTLGKDISKSKLWMRQVERMMISAEIMMEHKIFDQVCFYCQQVVEMGLKAVCWKHGTFSNRDEIHHDFIENKCPEEVQNQINEHLTPFRSHFKLYIYSRYVKDGSAPRDRYSSSDAKSLLDATREIFKVCQDFCC